MPLASAAGDCAGTFEQTSADTEHALQRVLDQLDHVTENLEAIEAEVIKVLAPCPESTLLKTLPGVGEILAVVIWTEIGVSSASVALRNSRATAAWWRACIQRRQLSYGRRREANARSRLTGARQPALDRQRCAYEQELALRRIKARRGYGKRRWPWRATLRRELLDAEQRRA